MLSVIDGRKFSAGSPGAGQTSAAGRAVARKKAAGGSARAPWGYTAGNPLDVWIAPMAAAQSNGAAPPRRPFDPSISRAAMGGYLRVRFRAAMRGTRRALVGCKGTGSASTLKDAPGARRRRQPGWRSNGRRLGRPLQAHAPRPAGTSVSSGCRKSQPGVRRMFVVSPQTGNTVPTSGSASPCSTWPGLPYCHGCGSLSSLAENRRRCVRGR